MRWGLTPAQARVAERIGLGWTVREVAADLGVQPNTIRTHLKEVFLRTKTRRQAELVRVLLLDELRPTRP